jgi:phosphoribosylanthranilate isomerase
MVKLKVCGMKYQGNIEKLVPLLPDYMGFIFYPKSKRNFEGVMPQLPQTIKKTGVFVDEDLDQLINLTAKYKLDALQLHGDESVEYIKELKEKLRAASLNKVEIIKAFTVGDIFEFEQLSPYQSWVDYFLFDTKGKDRGGNGISFDWNILKGYKLETPYFLSGGIGVESIDQIKDLLSHPSANLCEVLDLNSKFEEAPGLKNISLIEEFKKELNTLKL